MSTRESRWLDDDALRATSAGEVTESATYDYLALAPVRGGIYCEAIFGQLLREADQRVGVDARADRWGHIELGLAVPWGTGPTRSVVLVLPPVCRAIGHLTPAESLRRAKARRDDLVGLDAAGAWPYPDPLEELLEDEGLAGELDVLLDPPRWFQSALDVAYRRVLDAATKRGRLARHGAAPPIVDDATQGMVAACARLHTEIERSDLPEPVRRRALALAPD